MTVGKGASVDLAVVVKAVGLGTAAYSGMTVTFTYGSHTASQTVPAPVTAVGVKKYSDKAC